MPLVNAPADDRIKKIVVECIFCELTVVAWCVESIIESQLDILINELLGELVGTDRTLKSSGNGVRMSSKRRI